MKCPLANLDGSADHFDVLLRQIDFFMNHWVWPVGLFLAAVASIGAANDQAAAFERLKRELKPIDLNETVASSDTEAYLKFYSLKFDEVNHSIGTIQSGTNHLAVQVFRPPEIRGTVVLSHGYYDHAGVLKHLIRHLLDSGFAIAVLDHVGHGLSTGVPAEVGNFKEYVDGLNLLLEFCQRELPGPLHLVGHSMGCAVLLDSLLTGEALPVTQIVLLAPLVRSNAWKVSKLGLKLAGTRLDSVPRKFRRNSSDKQFLEFHRRDPLQAQTVPMSWVAAHHKWHDRIQTEAKTSQKKITIIQGNKDSTVDWKHNLEFIRQRMPNAKVLMIEGGGHQLINETEKVRTEVLEKVLAGIT